MGSITKSDHGFALKNHIGAWKMPILIEVSLSISSIPKQSAKTGLISSQKFLLNIYNNGSFMSKLLFRDVKAYNTCLSSGGEKWKRHLKRLWRKKMTNCDWF